MIHYDVCPACGSEKIEKDLDVKDYTVKSGSYAIWKCHHCTIKFTQDIPDEESIGRYYQSDDYVSHSDTQQGLIYRIYHLVRTITLRTKRKLIVKQAKKQTGTLLDIGCGTGSFLNEMKKNGWLVTGLEPDDGAAEKARSLNRITVDPPAALFELEHASFDVVSMWHVLEHVHRLHDYLDQIGKLLRKGGLLVVAVPNHTSADAAHYGAYWAAYDVPRHLYHFSPVAMQQLLEKHGYSLRQIKPMWFDSFYVSMLSQQYKNGKGNMIFAFFQGLMSNLKALFSKGHRCSSLIYIAQKQ